ncbi:LamG-like jellyroll fold domain-containing protein [Pedobacter sp. UC225_61]|uniref:LamG-like jellyroll fold domain-containing protein n=1 Tax=Pedobacter sp. UC225_61 TaxID=3374623 RepID=UPI0037AE7C3F
MKFSNLYTKGCMLGLVLAATVISSCKKDGNPNNLPDVSPSDYTGKIDGFSSSDEIYSKNLVAYWSFDGTKNELKTGTAPTSTLNDAFIAGGVKGQALSLTGGYMYYGKQFDAFKTTAFKSFTISEWVQILNNGSKKTMLFQIARPGIFDGSLDFILETNANPASNTDYIQIHPYFTTVGGGRQDNINNYGSTNLSPKIGASKWVHLLITYDGLTGTFDIWANAIKIGNYPNRGTGTSLFNSYEPSEIIMGANYNVIPGKSVNSDTNFGAMTGSIDEVRVYNTNLPQAYIKALYNLGLAGK